MKLIFASILLICAVTTVFGVDCEVNGYTFQVGARYTPTAECVEYTCLDDGSVIGSGCPAISAPLGCKYIPEDLSKKHPNCCDNYEC